MRSIHVLETLFEHVVLPKAVFAELSSSGAPPAIKGWLSRVPDLVTIQNSEFNLELKGLDMSEREVISLAEQLKAGFILVDEKKARVEARRRGLTVVGTIGILDRAASRQLVDLPEAIDRSKRTTFRISPEISEELLRPSCPPS